jgi:N-acetylglucosaminyl-diphospho-decaprenol L-rhamnosyltransferase
LAPLSIVIVAYHSGEFLRRCLSAVADCAPEIVVVDNGSPGRETEALCAAFANVRLIARERNDGFARAANAGVAASTGRWILLLNPDAWPEQSRAVDQLVRFAEEEPRLGAAGPQLLGADGYPQRSVIRPPRGAFSLAVWAAFPRAVSRLYGVWRGRARTAPREGEFLQASALLVRREAFEEIGGFDESFFMYGEDADLSARLREAGWRVAVCHEARFVHVGGGSTSGSDGGRMAIELLRSWLRLIAKQRGLRHAERARRWLLAALRLRRREPAAAAWLASGRAADLLDQSE